MQSWFHKNNGLGCIFFLTYLRVVKITFFYLYFFKQRYYITRVHLNQGINSNIILSANPQITIRFFSNCPSDILFRKKQSPGSISQSRIHIAFNYHISLVFLNLEQFLRFLCLSWLWHFGGVLGSYFVEYPSI